jgi:AraC-like DNA-binding protein
MTPLSSAEKHWVPASHADQLVQLARRWNVTACDLLSGLGLTEAAVQDPSGRLSAATYAAILERARTLTGEPGLGFYLGLQKRVTAYGYLGFAAMTASSLREALEIATQYTRVVTSLVQLRLHVEPRVACLVVEETVDMGSVRDIPLISLVFGMHQIAGTLTGRDLRPESLDLAIPEPDYFPRFKHLMPNARFEQPVSQIIFNASFLDLPLVQADRSAQRLAREQCDRALDTLDRQRDAEVERIRQVVWRDGGYLSLEKVAKTLAISSRTLKRRLAAQGLSFSSLLAQERRAKAMFLLNMQQISLEEVAERVGYSTLSNFARAFRQWTGRSPAAYRRSRNTYRFLPTSPVED